MLLLGPLVYNLGSASALGEMLSEICPIFFSLFCVYHFSFKKAVFFVVVVGFFFF
jgi:hypothetical protein